MFSYRSLGPFNCYVTQGGVGGCQKFPKKRYASVNFPPYRALQGVGGVKFCPKKCYVTVEWPLMFYSYMNLKYEDHSLSLPPPSPIHVNYIIYKQSNNSVDGPLR